MILLKSQSLITRSLLTLLIFWLSVQNMSIICQSFRIIFLCFLMIKIMKSKLRCWQISVYVESVVYILLSLFCKLQNLLNVTIVSRLLKVTLMMILRFITVEISIFCTELLVILSLYITVMCFWRSVSTCLICFNDKSDQQKVCLSHNCQN